MFPWIAMKSSTKLDIYAIPLICLQTLHVLRKLHTGPDFENGITIFQEIWQFMYVMSKKNFYFT